LASWRATRRQRLGRPYHAQQGAQTETIARAMESLPTGWGAPPKGWLLEALGFYGLDAVEEGLLIALVTGEPLLFVGRHGTAKTAICCRLGEVLGLSFHAYDAAKALFEDVVGFPDPSSLARGEVSYVPTPMSLWDKEFILVDELSRAQVQMQNKWLEVIRSHRLMGRDLPALQYVIAAMNPTDYLGAVPLDEALLSRFAVVVRMPEVSEMEEATALRVIAARSADDAPRLGEALSGRPGNGDELLRARRRLRRQLEAALERLPRVEALFGSAVINYVHEVSLHLAERGFAQDARRLGMIRRNILVTLALATGRRRPRSKRDGAGAAGARGGVGSNGKGAGGGQTGGGQTGGGQTGGGQTGGGQTGGGQTSGESGAGGQALCQDAFERYGQTPENVGSLVGRTLHLSLPFVADARPGPSLEMLGIIHGSAFEVAFDARPPEQAAGLLAGGLRPAVGARRLLAGYQQRMAELPIEEHYRVVNLALQRVREAPPERLLGALEDLKALGDLVCDRAREVPWEVSEHLLDGISTHLGLLGASPDVIVSLCAAERVEPRIGSVARLTRQCVAHSGLKERVDLEQAQSLYRRLGEKAGGSR
jgi:MoxR-like ATPase